MRTSTTSLLTTVIIGGSLLVAVATLSHVVWTWASPIHDRIQFSVHHDLLCQSATKCPEHLWVDAGVADPLKEKQLIFAVAHSHPLSSIDAALEKVSNPSSPLYGQWMSLQETAVFTKNDEAFRTVTSFLRMNGVPDWSMNATINRDYLVVTLPVYNANRLLGADFRIYERGQQRYIRTRTYSLPAWVAPYVDFVGGAIDLPDVRPVRHKQRVDTTEVGPGPVIKGYVTPQALNDVYHIDDNKASASNGATQSLFEALGQNFSPDDLALFQDKFHLPAVPVSTVIGPNSKDACKVNAGSCAEANLDVQYIMAVAQHAETTFWAIDASDWDPFTTWIVALANCTDPPKVHSISYGGVERETPALHRFNKDLALLAVRGITVVVSSGDDGVGNFPIRDNPQACGLNPSFPASCPYVVSVGATQGPESGQPEISCSSDTGGIITSGGGFSTVFPAPSYQAGAVRRFLLASKSDDLPPDEMFNRSGRGYPDVALLGYNYIVTDGGQFVAESGTSASAPVFAGMLTLINSVLIDHGRPVVGFVNPMLYSLAKHAAIYTDVTQGNNHCGAGRAPQITCCMYGFKAMPGWDPLTGLGSIHFANLKAAVLAGATKAPKQRAPVAVQ